MKSLISLAFITIVGNSETVTEKLPSSCKDLEDGTHYIQPLSNEQIRKLTEDDTRDAIPIKVQCSNGYTIINPNLDDNIQNYFSSYHPYHKAFAGPDLDDHVVWRKWFLPGRIDQHIIFTPSTDDCSSCTELNSYDHPGQTAYYMTGDLIGCNWPTKNLCSFDMDTLECSTCTPASFTSIGEMDSEMWGTCGQMPYHVDHPVYESHDMCTEGISTALPSIGRTGHACVCYKPSISVFNTANDFTPNTNKNDMETEYDLYENSEHIVKLSNNDFQYGTYRITNPGTYVLTEDIIFDFNKGDLESPNEIDAWFPKSTQSDEYPGAGDLDGWYWLGFYAGITVESDDVTINLNGYSIQMSDAFYLQQRWFVGILLANKPFIDTQGPTWTGTDIDSPSRVTIKDGTIGLTSHHGILGIRVEDVTIENVIIKDFETHGVAFNEFYGLTMTNVEIGPSSTKAFINGRYSLARMELPTLRAAAEQIGEETIKSPKYGEISFNDLLDKLIDQLDMVFNYVYQGIEYSGNEWEEAYNTFINPTGLPSGGAVYGAIFRPRGASVMNFGKYDGNGYSERLTLNNVEIHDLSIETEEIPTFGTDNEMWVRDSINAPIPFTISTNNKLASVPEMKYEGNLWTDIVLALKKHATSWWHLGRMSLSNTVIEWAESGKSWKDHEDSETIHCNMDSLGHLVKGVLAIKMEYVTDVSITGLDIHDIASVSPLGSTVCGEYHDGKDGGHALQAKVTNEGWGGSNSYGIWFTSVEDVEINGLQMSNMVSYNGRIFGIKGYESEHEITLKSAKFSNFFSGVMLDDNVGYEDAWPNSKASACAVEDDNFVGDNKDIDVSCIQSRAMCTCDYVSCAGTINNECNGFEINTPIHKLSVSSEKIINIEEKNINMKIGLRDEEYVALLEKFELQLENEIEEENNNEELYNIVKQFDESINVDAITSDSHSSNSNKESLFEKIWKKHWIFIVLGLLGLLVLTYAIYRLCKRRRRQMRQKRLLEKENIENIENVNEYSQGLVTVDDSDEEF